MPKNKKPSKRLQMREVQTKEEKAEIAEVSAKAKEIEERVISLTPEQQKDAADWLWVRVNDAMNSKVWTDTKDRIYRMRQYYEAGVPRTFTGMDGSHDYRSWLAASQADAMKSRLLNIFAVDPIIRVEGRNEIGRANAQKVELFLDHHHDVQVDLAKKGDEICSYLPFEGHAVIYAPWVLQIDKEYISMEERQVYVNGPQVRMVDINSPAETSKAEVDGFVAKDPPEFKVIEVKKPEIIKNWPDVQVFSLVDYLNPKNSKPGKTPAWEAIRVYYSLDELEEMEDEGKIYKGSVKEMKLWLKERPLEAQKPAVTGGTDSISDSDDAPFEEDALDAVVECWMIWGKQKVPGTKRLQATISLYHHDSCHVLNMRHNPYIGKPQPFFHPRLISAPWRWSGIGVMELASPGERTINDLSNFVLDEGRIFSCLPYKYNKKRLPGGLSPFEFWKGIGLLNMNDFQTLDFKDRRPMDINVATFVRGNTERRTGQGDLQLGRESDVTGKQPPTARGIISILREGQVRFTMLNYSAINELVRLGGYEILLFQQLAGDTTPVEILGEDGRNLFPNGMSKRQLLGSFKYTPNMTAQNMVRELDAELNMLLYDKLQENPFIKNSMGSFYEMTKDVLLSMGKKKLWIKPLSFYQNAAGHPEGQTGNLTPDEQKFVQTLMQAGVPMEEIKRKLEQLRGNVVPEEGAPNGNEEISPEIAQQLLTGGQTGE